MNVDIIRDLRKDQEEKENLKACMSRMEENRSPSDLEERRLEEYSVYGQKYLVFMDRSKQCFWIEVFSVE